MYIYIKTVKITRIILFVSMDLVENLHRMKRTPNNKNIDCKQCSTDLSRQFFLIHTNLVLNSLIFFII